MSLSQPNSFLGSKHLLELYSNISICINFFEYTRNKLCSLTVVFNKGRKQNFEILSNAEKTSLSSSFSRREREWHNCKTWFWKCYKWLLMQKQIKFQWLPFPSKYWWLGGGAISFCAYRQLICKSSSAYNIVFDNVVFCNTELCTAKPLHSVYK